MGVLPQWTYRSLESHVSFPPPIKPSSLTLVSFCFIIWSPVFYIDLYSYIIIVAVIWKMHNRNSPEVNGGLVSLWIYSWTECYKILEFTFYFLNRALFSCFSFIHFTFSVMHFCTKFIHLSFLYSQLCIFAQNFGIYFIQLSTIQTYNTSYFP